VPSVAGAVGWLKRQPGVDPSRVAVAGFCLGGGAAIRFAAAHPGAARAVGVFYGRPLDAAAPAAAGAAGAGKGAARGGGGGAATYAALQGVPVYGVFGGRDTMFSPEVVDGFEVGWVWRGRGGGMADGGGRRVPS
jgi:dienelactone hydrolase